MSGSYGVGTNYLSFTAGTAGAVGSGAYTLVVLVQPAVGNNGAGMLGGYTSGTANRDLFEDANALFGQNDFSSGFGALTQGNWYLCAQTKAAGSNTYRHHLWAYASDGSGTMSHGVATGSASHGDGSAIDEIRIGATEVPSNGLIAVVALWTVALSDADLDGFKSANLSSWTTSSSGSPKELISLENWNGTSGASVLIGTSSYSSTTGTVSSGSNPPSFNFSLAAGPTAAPILIAPGRSGPGGRWQLPPLDFTTASAASANAENTTATGVANAPTADLQTNAGNTTATGTANDAQAAIAVNAEATSATGAAFDATVSTAANTSANAENAAGTGTANDATVALATSADVATATGTAFDATVSITINAGVCTATGSAFDAQAGAGGQADVALGTGTANTAALAIQANAEAAAALGAALSATTAGATVKATSTPAVTAGRTSTDTVTARWTSTAAATARRTSTGGVT